MQEARTAGCRVHLTLNAFLHAGDWEPLREHIGFLNRLQPDALIVSDPALLQLLSRETDLPLHVSTQCSCSTREALAFWAQLGARRVVLARELSLADLSHLRAETPLELEVFVHGAMCSSWSGKCTIANYLSGVDANRGGCTQPCRWEYAVSTAGSGQYLFSRELNMLAQLPELLASGVDSLKLEGRMRSLYYVATITRLYRQALDHIRQRRQQGEEPEQELLDDLATQGAAIGNRGFTTGNYLRRAGLESISRTGTSGQPQLRYLGYWLASDKQSSWFAITAPFDLATADERLEAITTSGSAISTTCSRPEAPVRLDPADLTGPAGERLVRLHPNSVVRLRGSFNPHTILQVRRQAVAAGERVV